MPEEEGDDAMRMNVTPQAQLALENAGWPEHLVEMPKAAWRALADSMKHAPSKVFRSRHFLVQEFSEGSVIRLSVNRASVKSEGGWADQITWEELQQVKRECGYGDRDAVEVYPADRDVVNVANMRHLWVLSEPLPFVWRKR